VLQRLETADWHTELPTGLQIFERRGIGILHRTNRLGASEDRRKIDGLLDCAKRFALGANQGGSGHENSIQAQVSRPLTIMGAQGLHRQAGARGLDQKQGQAAGIARGPCRARRDDQTIRSGRSDHNRFLAADPPPSGDGLGPGLDPRGLIACGHLLMRPRQPHPALGHRRQQRCAERIGRLARDQTRA